LITDEGFGLVGHIKYAAYIQYRFEDLLEVVRVEGEDLCGTTDHVQSLFDVARRDGAHAA
jgi:hypothetical protein